MTGPRSPSRGGLPNLRRLLTWLFAGRALLAFGTMVAAALIWTSRPDVAFLVAVGVVLALLITAYGIWVINQRQRHPGPVFLTFQLLADLGLIIALVHVVGPEGSIAPALYVLLIATYAVLMPFRFGIAMTAMSSAVFVADMWQHTGPTVAMLLHVGVFLTVFVVVAVLGEQLREAGEERQSLTSELRRVRYEAEVILRNIHSGVLTVAWDGSLVYANPTAQQLLGFERTPVPGETLMEMLQRRAPGLRDAVAAGLTQGRRIRRGEALVERGDGQFPIGLSTTTFRPGPGTQASVTAVFSDISDSKRLAELHLRTERLEAVAALSASLAHEIRNPLASIRSSVEQLARGAHAGDDERTLAALIIRESERLSRLLSEFLDFSRVRATRSEPVDVHAVASAAAGVVRAHPDCPAGTQLLVEGEHVMLLGDEDLLHRSLVNLIMNAVQAADEEAVQVVVSVAAVDASQAPRDLPADRAVRITVSDTGPGIPDDIRERLFEPFVTRRRGGTGLGLAIVQRAVEAHRGLIFADSVPPGQGAGQGTTFTIYLPDPRVAEDDS